MKWHHGVCAATLVVLALSAAGCAAPPTKTAAEEAVVPEESAPTSTATQVEPETGGFGQYRLELDGAVVTVDIPAPSDDPVVKKVEKYRKRYEIKPFSYLKAATDNGKGGKDSWIPGTVVVVTDSGKQAEYVYASVRVEKTWLGVDGVGSKQSDAANDLAVEIHPLNDGVLLPGAVGESILAATEEPDSVKSVHWRSKNVQEQFTKVQ